MPRSLVYDASNPHPNAPKTTVHARVRIDHEGKYSLFTWFDSNGVFAFREKHNLTYIEAITAAQAWLNDLTR